LSGELILFQYNFKPSIIASLALNDLNIDELDWTFTLQFLKRLTHLASTILREELNKWHSSYHRCKSLFFSKIATWDSPINGIFNRFPRFFLLTCRFWETTDAFCPQAAISCCLSIYRFASPTSKLTCDAFFSRPR